MYIYDNLRECAICKVDMTGIWEEKLEMIRQGELELNEMERDMMDDVENMINEIKSMTVTSVLLGDNRKIVGECPECGGSIVSGPKSFYCSNYKENGCKFGLFKDFMGSKISDKDFEKLLEHKTIKKSLTSKAGKTWEQELEYDFENHKLEFVQKAKSTYEAKETDYTCPNCGSDLVDTGKTIKCECGFTLWKSVCGKELTSKQLDNFFNAGDTGLINGLKSKAGKEFNAHIVLSDDKMGTKLQFE